MKKSWNIPSPPPACGFIPKMFACEELALGLFNLSEWSTNWQMRFDITKYKKVHTRAIYPNLTYALIRSELTCHSPEKESWYSDR